MPARLEKAAVDVVLARGGEARDATIRQLRFVLLQHRKAAENLLRKFEAFPPQTTELEGLKGELEEILMTLEVLDEV